MSCGTVRIGSALSTASPTRLRTRATVVRVVCICDRLQGAREALAKYDFRPLFTIRDFGIEPPAPGN